MADADKADNKKGGMAAQIIGSVAVAILVGGTSPWWFNAFFNKPAPANAPQPVVSQPVVSNPAEASPVASNDFFVGRWRVDQEIGDLSGGNVVDYFRNGRFEGQQIQVSGNQGRKVPESGAWVVDKLSDRTFRLTLSNDDGTRWTGKFKILDQNHIQNINQNYVAERVQ